MAKRRAHGEGSIVQIADGTWRAAVPLTDGRRKWLRGKTRAEVARKAAEVKATRDQGMPVTSGRETLGAYLDRWLEESARPSVRPGTYRAYSSHVRVHIKPALGHVTLARLSPAHVQHLVNSLPAADLSPASVTRVHATLRRALGQAERWGLVSRNVAKLVTLPKVEQHEIAVFTLDEARAFLAAIRGHRLEALVTVALAMGLRQGEALGLRWEDVDLDAGTMRVRFQLQRHPGPDAVRLTDACGLAPTKSHRSRRVLAVPSPLVAQLRTHRARQSRERLLRGDDWQDCDLVFCTRRGTPLDGPNVTHRFQDLLAELGLPRRRFHDLRHSCGSLLAAQGVPLHEIQAILGHAQLSTTMVYVHSVPEGIRRAADQMGAVLWGSEDELLP